MQELTGIERLSLSKIIINKQNELTINCVINSISPGNVFVDDALTPKSFLIKTPECNLLGGYAFNEVFNAEIRSEIDYFDTLLCDTSEWFNSIMKIHPNIALRPYKRKYYARTSKSKIAVLDAPNKIEYIYIKNINNMTYKNKEIVIDWINILNLKEIQNICLAALVIIDDQIVSCSCIDCYTDKHVEIGIKTIKEYEKNGYGFCATSALVNELNSNGITDIGWHCMSTNIGSQKIAEKCGFKEIIEYSLFSPYPPIENTNDVSIKDWKVLGAFYTDMVKKCYHSILASSKVLG